MRLQSIPFTLFLIMLILTLTACAPAEGSSIDESVPADEAITAGDNLEPGGAGYTLPVASDIVSA